MGNFAENLNLGKRVLPPSLGDIAKISRPPPPQEKKSIIKYRTFTSAAPKDDYEKKNCIALRMLMLWNKETGCCNQLHKY